MPKHMVKMQNRYTQALYLSTGYSDFIGIVMDVEVGLGRVRKVLWGGLKDLMQEKNEKR